MTHIRIAISIAVAAGLSNFVVAQAETSNSVDFSGLGHGDQAKANVLHCLGSCAREDIVDERFERSRYDRYYTVGSPMVPSDLDDPDSDPMLCREISCERPESRAHVGSICDARLNRLNSWQNCTIVCTEIGKLYDDTLFDEIPYSTYASNIASHTKRICEDVNRKPFANYISTCPEILFTDDQPLDCSTYDEEAELTIDRHEKTLKVDQHIATGSAILDELPLQ